MRNKFLNNFIVNESVNVLFSLSSSCCALLYCREIHPLLSSLYIDMSNQRNGEIPLPQGWELGRDYDGKVYFIDHNNKKTTWVDPRDRYCIVISTICAVKF